MQVKGAVAVVTGGASGLGEATARRLVAEGAKVAMFDLSADLGNSLADELGTGAIFVNTNVVDEASVIKGFERTAAELGKVDILINCAGIGTPQKVISKKGPHSLADFSKVIQVNLIGTFNTIRIAAEMMSRNTPNGEGERGVIVNTSSAAAFEGQIGQAAYGASKGGVVSMTLPIARELASAGIRVIAVAPGLFETPMLATLPQEVRDALGKTVPFPPRLGRPREFAHAVQFIIENPMMNGCTLRLDGAIRMQPR